MTAAATPDAPPDAHAKAADILLDCRRTGEKIDSLPEDCRPATLRDSYAVQRCVVERAGAAQVGWKVAATNAATQAAIGITEPFAGRLPNTAIARSPWRVPAGRFNAPAVEGEFAVMLRDDLLPANAPFDSARVAGAVGCAIPAVEIVDGAIGNRETAGPATVVAAGSVSGLVLGRPHFDWGQLNLSTHRVVLTVNGVVVAEGDGAAVLGDPMNALAWLANLTASMGEGLVAGEIVTLGTCTGLTPVSPGDQVVVAYGGLGTVEVSF